MTDQSVEAKTLPSHEKPEMLAPHEERKLLTEKQDHVDDKPSTSSSKSSGLQEQRIADLENLAKRLQAEFENFRKQTEKEKAELRSFANAALLQKLLPVLDEIEHSLHAAEQHGDKEVVRGLWMAHQNLWKLLEAEGLKPMVVGHAHFDPYQHEALRYEESDQKEGHVASVLRKGYYFRDRVLRPAGVVVSKGKQKAEGEKND